jgi:glyoxylase-like metal-dependent hydrolase (beta-lactamase superfamily II)
MVKVLFFLFIFLATAFGGEYPQHVSETLKKIKDSVYGVFGVYEQVSYQNRGFISNAYFIVTKEGVLVVDVLSTYKLGKELLETIKKVTDKPVKFAVITHYHTDHFYGVKAFKEEGAVVIAHRWAEEYVSKESSWNFYEARKKILKEHLDGTTMEIPHIYIEDDEGITVELGDKTFVIRQFCKGHTAGDIMVWIPQDRVLFGGDIVFDGRLPFLGSGFSKSWLRCLDRIGEMDPLYLLPGHGKPMLSKERIRERVRWTRKYISDLRKTIRRMIEEGRDLDYIRENINEALIELDPMYAQVPVFFDVNPVNAYYVYFEIENELIEEGQ